MFKHFKQNFLTIQSNVKSGFVIHYSYKLLLNIRVYIRSNVPAHITSPLLNVTPFRSSSKNRYHYHIRLQSSRDDGENVEG